MNYRERFKEIVDFLKPYQTIWQNEIMLLYPNPLDHYPQDWIDELTHISDKEQLILIERKQTEGLIQNPGLKAHYQKLKELIDLPFAKMHPAMPANRYTFLYVTPKKQHEIRQLAPILDTMYRSLEIEKIIDIGGGIGLLAQSLVNEYGHKVCSVDLDPQMQKTGFVRHKQNAKNPDNLVEYKNVKIELGDNEFSNILNPSHMTVGLHTCGALATAQIEASVQRRVKAIVNFGCCYHKLEPFPQAQNLSQYAKELGPLNLGRFALTLSARAHIKLPEKDYDFKIKVKFFRYAIHFLLQDEYGFKDQATLGNSDRSLYDESFGTYVLDQFKRINLTPKHSKQELDDYYNDPERQKLIYKMLAGGTIRDSFGRALELYLLLDRVIYLEEQGYQAELLQCFDEVTSPRNLGIFSRYQRQS